MFPCQVSGCDEKFDDPTEFAVHSSYHDYHQKIKELGGKELEQLRSRLDMSSIKCPLEDKLDGDYYFPQLPTKLICKWYECRLEFSCVELFYDHVSNHAHRIVDKCYWSECNKEFKSAALTVVRDHLRVHTLQKLYACPHCGNFFSTKIKFDDHFLRHLNLDDFLKNKFNLTPKTITCQKGQLNYEERAYEMNDGTCVKIFKCTFEDCDKTFLTSSLLREHIRIHSSKNQCDQCKYVANSLSRLESHKLYRHQTERSFECTICLKTFKQRGDLRAHVRRHQIVDPYRCDKCDFETLNEEGLNKHLKLHTNHLYLCHLCQRMVSRGSNLSRHFRDQHNLEPPNGLSRFRYKLTSQNLYILDTIDESEAAATRRPESLLRDQLDYSRPNSPIN